MPTSRDPEKLVEVLQLFFDHRQPHEVDWEDAVTKFAEKIPDLARGVTAILEKEYAKNAAFRENFDSFADLCRQSINPDLTDDAIRKMLVQHLLTERIFRKVFNNQEFLSRNVIAAEIEKVIRSITARHFSRDEFLKPLDRFYTAIEKAAESQTGYTEKQHFLNAVYEKFFQRFDIKQAVTPTASSTRPSPSLRARYGCFIDQYQVSTDKRSGIVNDPNREDDPE